MSAYASAVGRIRFQLKSDSPSKNSRRYILVPSLLTVEMSSMSTAPLFSDPSKVETPIE